MPRALKVYTELFEFDSAIRTQYPVFCGVDEAGRGPLAGDVYAAAVILPEGLEIPADHRIEPDTCSLTDFDITDYRSRRS